MVQIRNPYCDWQISPAPYVFSPWMGILDTYSYANRYFNSSYSNPGTHHGKSHTQGNSRWYSDIPISYDFSDDESEAGLSDEDVIRDIWISSLNLTDQDMIELDNGEQLSDKHIYAAQRLLHHQFPEMDGLQDTCLSQTQFKSISGETPALQIHHTRGNHWVLSSTVAADLCVYDSLYSSITQDLKKQLCDIYGSSFCDEHGQLGVTLPSVQNQKGSQDCGLFAIAFAYELCQGSDPSTIVFKQSEMRQHLIKCFEQGELTSFPALRTAWREQTPSYKQEVIDCSITLT